MHIPKICARKIAGKATIRSIASRENPLSCARALHGQVLVRAAARVARVIRVRVRLEV